ncbi:MAG: response regulator, partial [Desulfovibrionales bacterium]|nr:response regulator [Desulfovibrionales bacterium]
AKETPEDTVRHLEHIAKHGLDDFETLHRHKDGSLIDVHVTVILLHMESKPYLLCVFRNISDKKTATLALEQSEQRFRDVAEAAGEYLWEIEPGGTYIFLTSRVEELLGRKVKELTGRSPFDFMPAAEAERVEKLLTGWAEKNQSWQGLEHQSIRADGKIVWQRVSGLPMLDSQGQLIGFRGTGLDITAEKEAWLAQQELSDRLSLATQAAELGIWDLRLDYDHLEWDEGMFRIYGLEHSQFNNAVSDWHDMVLPEYRERAAEDFKQGIASGKSYFSEFRIRRGDGQIRHIMAIAQSITNDNGNPVRVVGVNQDVTERKQAEEKLNEYAQQVERKNIELDAALIKAEAASRSKSEFLANMSHEIRTPMNAVIGLSQLLLQTSLTDQQRDYLNKISGSSRMLLIEAGKLELDIHTFRLDELLDQMKTLFGPAAGKKDLELVFRVSPDVPYTLEGDSLRLGQIFTNLMSNAIKFTEEGHVELVVGIEKKGKEKDKKNSGMLEYWDAGIEGKEKDDAGMLKSWDAGIEDKENAGTDSASDASGATRSSSISEPHALNMGQEAQSEEQEIAVLRFEINDTGIGMDQEQLSRLFQAFSQADTSTTRKYGGTGLGLVISRKLVEKMGGSLSVVSSPGEGSSFSFELSLPVSGNSYGDLECSGLEAGRALVVDDHEAPRAVLKDILASCMLEVEEAHSGQSAVDAVIAADKAGKPFDYIFMDWKMPGELDGLGAIKKIEDLHAQDVLMEKSSPVVIVSAYSRDELPEQSSKCVNCFLSKPVTASSVFDAMGNVSGKASRHPRNKESAPIPSFANASILVVEDNVLNQEVVEQMLEKTGAVVTLANNGAEAVEIAESGNFDLVLMDLQMPVMDGFEASRKILEKSPDLTIIALSAAVFEVDRKRAKEAGMKAHIAKPIDSALLYRTLTGWLKVSEGKPEKMTVPSSESVDLPDHLEGFDLEKGLKSADGDRAFYHKMLHRFREQLSGEFARVDEELEKGKTGDGPRLVHTLKGIAGTVGAYNLARTAENIDHAYKDGRQISEQMRNELSQAVQEAKDQLSDLSPLPDKNLKVSRADAEEAISEMLKSLNKSEMIDDELLN